MKKTIVKNFQVGRQIRKRFTINLELKYTRGIDVTSFYIISYCSNSECCSQKAVRMISSIPQFYKFRTTEQQNKTFNSYELDLFS